MRASEIHVGDPVQVDVRGQKFNAFIKGVDGRQVSILPFNPQRYSYRTVTARQVVEKLEVQGRLGVAS